MKNLLAMTALIETGAGLLFLASPPLAAKLLFDSGLEIPAAVAIGRLTGAALLSLGIACGIAWREGQSRSALGLIAAMLLYNLAAASTLASAGFSFSAAGVALWPGFVLHVAMALWCMVGLRAARST